MKYSRRIKPQLRSEVLGYIAALAFFAIAAYAIGLITSSLATLGIDWYWWLGFALFIFTASIVVARREKPSRRRHPRAEEIDLAKERYEFESRRDSWLEDRMLRRVA